MALSMDEQRILDEMERSLAADDPRLAARLGAFGQARLAGPLRSHARTVGGVLVLAFIAAITVAMFVVSPFASHIRTVQPPRSTASSATAQVPARGSSSSQGPAAQHTGTGQ